MKSTDEITNSQDIIDSRDVIARIEELRGQLDACIEAVIDADAEDNSENEEEQEEITERRDKVREDLADWLGCNADDLPASFATINGDFPLKDYRGSDEARELYALEQMASEAEGYGDWHHGETLIRDSYFREYAEQMAEDIGAIDRSAGWPNNHINWEFAADELKQDYTSVTFDGVDYWMRS